MSKISDEIRTWCDDTYMGSVDGLYALADRIDKELMELPRDRDGVPIHVGDTVWDAEDGMEFVVKSVTLYAGDVTKVDAVCAGCHAHVSPDTFSHTRPDSWERIADEFDEWRFEHMHYLVADDLKVDDLNDLGLFAERIRKLAEKEH